MRLFIFLFLLCFPQLSFAELFQVKGDTLFYSMEYKYGKQPIKLGHDDQLLKVLEKNKNIKLLKLESSGGNTEVAKRMANIIIDAQLDTHVNELCSSSCVRLFLAGNTRTANLGAQIGLHRSSWSAEGMEIYYKEYKGEYKWETPFEFSSWVYDETQKDFYELAEYFSERGVASYVIGKTYRLGADEMWYMRREELLKSGVLTE